MSIERIEPFTVEWEAFYSNHIHRYKFALDEIKKSQEGALILDAACGVGYGAFYLNENCNCKIVGIDINEKALSIATKNFSSKGITYLKDDCTYLQMAKGYAPFDYVVSFETLEHLKEPEIFLDNIFNLLKKEGTLILSTPNANLGNGKKNPVWSYHEKEYTAEELTKLLTSIGFNKIELFGQKYSFSGKIKNQIRAELNTLAFNPFQRLGREIQKIFRKRKFNACLPETLDDLDILAFPDPAAFDDLKIDIPFVVIAVAKK